jgi:hypothetical protein
MRLDPIPAAFAVLAASLAPQAGADELDLTGIWRDETAQEADRTEPVKIALPDKDTSEHGTYLSLPYIAILRAKNGALHFHSDVGAIWAELTPRQDAAGVYDLASVAPANKGEIVAVLRTSTKACDPRPACFQLHPPDGGKAGDLPLPGGDRKFYVPLDPYEPADDPKQDQTYGSNFAPVTAGFTYVTLCYAINNLDVHNIQENTGCRAVLFQPPDTDSYAYKKVGYAGGGVADIPFGWTYKLDDAAVGSSRVKTIDTGRELSDSSSLDVGVKASVNLFGFDAEAHVDVATSQKIQDITDAKSIVAEANEVKTKFALVLNRYYTRLSPEFVRAVRDLKGKPGDHDAYQVLIQEFGTHYPNAVTFGARGSRKLTLDEKTINSLRDKQTNIGAGLSVKYEGSGGGVDVKSAQEAMSAIKNLVSTENRDFRCYGGGDCSEDGVPSGNDIVPIYLDLRPLSDLLAPPLFMDEEILGRVRARLSRAILAAAYVRRDGLDDPTLTIVQATNPSGTPLGAPQLLCGDAAPSHVAGSPSPMMSTFCCDPLAVAEPVVASMTIKGASDPLVRPQGPGLRRPVSIDPPQIVALPDQQDTTPIVSDLIIDYLFIHQRDDTDTTGVYTPDLNAFCQARYGDGFAGQLAGQTATCASSTQTQQVKMQDVCTAEHGKSASAVWSEVEAAWLCGFGSQLPVDANVWCQAQHGPASTARATTGFLGPMPFDWSCDPGGRMDPAAVCATLAGRSYKPQWNNAPDRDGNLVCEGQFEGVRKAAPADATIRTYPDLQPFDATALAPGGDPVNVVLPLAWQGDSALSCSGVALDLVIGLQTAGPEILVSGQ